MADQKIIEYIKQSREKGFSDEEIRKTLLEAGWTREGVEEGLKTTGTTKKKRGTLLSIWLVLMLVSNTGSALISFLGASFVSKFYLIPIEIAYIYGIFSFFNAIFTIFLFRWKKWAFFALCETAGIGFLLNVFIIKMTIIWPLLGLMGLVILYFILRPKWKLFESSKHDTLTLIVLFIILIILFSFSLIKEKQKPEISSKFPGLEKYIEICKDIKNVEIRGYCYFGISEAVHDVDVCNMIKSSGWLRSRCYEETARAKQDFNICEKYTRSTARDICYKGVAKAKEDFTICEKINDTLMKSSCYEAIAELKGNQEICEKNTISTHKDDCYRTLAKLKIDRAICENIENSGFKDWCYRDVAEASDEFTKKKAISERNPDLCEEIKNNTSCYTEVAKAAMDPVICERIEHSEYDTYYMEECFKEVAVVKKDLLICEKIDPGAILKLARHKQECAGLVGALKNQDPHSCKIIESDYSRGECYQDFAEMVQDIGACNLISPELTFKEWCYTDVLDVLIENRNITLDTCKTIDAAFPIKIDSCYKKLAEIKEDVSEEDFNIICDKINDAELKGICYQTIIRKLIETTYKK